MRQDISLTKSMKKKMGRPRLAKEKAKGIIIGARFSVDEAKAVHGAISRTGQKKPDWVRNALLAAAKMA